MNTNFKNWLDSKKTVAELNESFEKEDLKQFINNIKGLLFPGFVEPVEDMDIYLDDKINSIKLGLKRLLTGIERLENIKIDKNKLINDFLNQLPEVDEILTTDVDALYAGDPAAKSKAEIILCYPGLTAIYIYRVAHVLSKLGVPMLPRLMSEYAHSKTGIDIHPGATIGKYFFIDHGTGIVIGETCEIGEHVKIYQGVTLGALSTAKGQALKDSKRHPTIKDYVTIYSGASIFGGETIIGNNSTIGSNAYIVSSVDDDMIVTIQGQQKRKSK